MTLITSFPNDEPNTDPIQDIMDITVAWFGSVTDVLTLDNSDIISDAIRDSDFGVTDSANIGNDTIVTTDQYKLYYDIGWGLQIYFLPVMGVIGFIGNIITMAVMLMKRNRPIACCIYMFGLALSDNMAVAAVLYYWYLTAITKTTYDLQCQLWIYFAHVGTFTGVILLVAMSVDRFTALAYALKYRTSHYTDIIAKVTLVVAFVFSVIYNIPYGMSAKSTYGELCSSFTITHMFFRAYSYLTIFLNSFLPFVILLTMNCCIIHQVKSRRKVSPVGQLAQEVETPKDDFVERSVNGDLTVNGDLSDYSSANEPQSEINSAGGHSKGILETRASHSRLMTSADLVSDNDIATSKGSFQMNVISQKLAQHVTTHLDQQKDHLDPSGNDISRAGSLSNAEQSTDPKVLPESMSQFLNLSKIALPTASGSLTDKNVLQVSNETLKMSETPQPVMSQEETTKMNAKSTSELEHKVGSTSYDQRTQEFRTSKHHPGSDRIKEGVYSASIKFEPGSREQDVPQHLGRDGGSSSDVGSVRRQSRSNKWQTERQEPKNQSGSQRSRISLTVSQKSIAKQFSSKTQQGSLKNGSVGKRNVTYKVSQRLQKTGSAMRVQSPHVLRKHHKNTRENQLVILLLMVSFTFLVLTMPQYIRYITFMFIDRKSSNHVMAIYYLVSNVTNKAYYLNNMTNFFLYTLGGSKFRKDAKEVIFRAVRFLTRFLPIKWPVKPNNLSETGTSLGHTK